MLQDASIWSKEEACDFYGMLDWSQGYFGISDDGHLLVRPACSDRQTIDVPGLVDRLHELDLAPPFLVRFCGILSDRIQRITDAFRETIDATGYRGNHRSFFPIKVNQQWSVVESVMKAGRRSGFGLEVGSKSELFYVVAAADDRTPILCNGFKDAGYVRAALFAEKMRRSVSLVVEKPAELDLILDTARELEVRPRIGLRIKLAASGSDGQRRNAGERSKFGLAMRELLDAADRLSELGLSDCLQLLHFHFGSQVTDLRDLREALKEATHVYTELHRLGFALTALNIGGGMGVDYGGRDASPGASPKYSLREYAAEVVSRIAEVCDKAKAPHPDIFAETGRAAAAHHSILVFNVLEVGNSQPDETSGGLSTEPATSTSRVEWNRFTADDLAQLHRHAKRALDETVRSFREGRMNLECLAQAECRYAEVCREIGAACEAGNFTTSEFERLEDLSADVYFCNFSLFQSLPDAWAINQLFPVMPIQRLRQRPTQRAVLADITCDSDGRIDAFVERSGVRQTLAVHRPNGEPYYLAAFLVGAYQEALGAPHNLFGSVNTVEAGFDSAGNVQVLTYTRGDTIGELLGKVRLDQDPLNSVCESIDAAVRQGRLDEREADSLSRFFEQGLNDYTYLRSSQPVGDDR